MTGYKGYISKYLILFSGKISIMPDPDLSDYFLLGYGTKQRTCKDIIKMALAGVTVTVEPVLEHQIQEVKLDGQEVYVPYGYLMFTLAIAHTVHIQMGSQSTSYRKQTRCLPSLVVTSDRLGLIP